MVAEPVVDIHCHVFNADDLPVRGFRPAPAPEHPGVGPNAVDPGGPGRAGPGTWVPAGASRGSAGSWPRQVARPTLLAKYLARKPWSPRWGMEAGSELETDVDLALADLMADDPVFVRRLTAALEAETGTPASIGAETAEGWFDRLDTTRRAVRWARLFGLSRLDIAAELRSNVLERSGPVLPTAR